MELRDLGEETPHPCYLFAALYHECVGQGIDDPMQAAELLSLMAMQLWAEQEYYEAMSELMMVPLRPQTMSRGLMERLFGLGAEGFSTQESGAGGSG